MLTPEKANFVAALEREVVEKYGKEAAINIHSLWTEEKEESFIEQMKAEAKKEREYFRQKKAKLQRKSLVTKQGQYCEVCKKLTFDGGGATYMDLYGCCKRCYHTYVIGEEDRWEQKRKRLIKENT